MGECQEKLKLFPPFSPALFLERRTALGSREIHPPVRAGQSLPGPGGEVLRWARTMCCKREIGNREGENLYNFEQRLRNY